MIKLSNPLIKQLPRITHSYPVLLEAAPMTSYRSYGSWSMLSSSWDPLLLHRHKGSHAGPVHWRASPLCESFFVLKFSMTSVSSLMTQSVSLLNQFIILFCLSNLQFWMELWRTFGMKTNNRLKENFSFLFNLRLRFPQDSYLVNMKMANVGNKYHTQQPLCFMEGLVCCVLPYP